VLKVIPVDENGEIHLDDFKNLINEKTKFVSLVQVSNGIGTINAIKEFIDIAHAHQIPVMIDGCQAAPHMEIDVQALDCDFYTFSGHKVFGPTGIGVLYGKESLLEVMPPYQFGGDMIRHVSFQKTTFNDLPYKFEAGTPHISGAIGLAAAFDYLNSLGRGNLLQYENELFAYADAKLNQEVAGIRLLGNARKKIPVFSFVVEGTHPLDIGTMLDFEGIAIRTGNHCTQPLMERFGVSASARLSLAFYNTKEEVDKFVIALNKVLQLLR
jgi:cysteine desulfurase/selenocysteine lyase